jgi:hypothetical protein
MKSKNRIAAIIISSILVLSLTGCNRTSTGNKEADGALTSFNNMVKTYPENKGFHKALQHWGFKLPGDYKFEWTKDTAANKIDYAMVIQADPLIKAGLDPNKLDQKDLIFKPAAVEDGVSQNNRIVHPYNVSDKREISSGSEDAFRRLFKQDSSLIKYDKDEKNYVLMLGEGYEVHWAEKLGSIDKDMAFVLPASPLIKAGLDINRLEGTGWKLEKGGQDVKNDQLIRSFKLK